MPMVSDRGCAPRRSPLRIHARPGGLLPLALLALAACDFPTALPKWDTQWLVPVQNTTVGADHLLPGGVSLADNTAFAVSVAPATLSRSLGEMCGSACTAVSGLMVPKPAFTSTLVDTLRFPPEATSATLGSGVVTLAVTNGFGFDPLRPGATSRGTLTVTLTSGSTSLGALSLSGDSVALPPGSTLTRDVVLTAGAVSNQILAQMTLVSPAGDPVRIDPTERVSLTATPQQLRLTDVSVAVTQKQVAIEPFELDLTGIDQTLIDRVQGGALVLNIVNPFGVTGTIALRFTSSDMSPIAKSVALAAGTSSPSVDFTPEELRTMLGRQVTVTGTGPLSAPQAVKLTPAAAVRITTRLSLVIGSKEG